MDEKNKIYKRNILARYARFSQNILLAILIGIVWSIYAILEKKTNEDNNDIICDRIYYCYFDNFENKNDRLSTRWIIYKSLKRKNNGNDILAGVVGIILYNLSLSTHKPHK